MEPLHRTEIIMPAILSPCLTVRFFVQVVAMEPPYGECNASNPVPMSNCQVDCRTEMLVEKCGCRDIYMKNLTTGTCIISWLSTDIIYKQSFPAYHAIILSAINHFLPTLLSYYLQSIISWLPCYIIYNQSFPG